MRRTISRARGNVNTKAARTMVPRRREDGASGLVGGSPCGPDSWPASPAGFKGGLGVTVDSEGMDARISFLKQDCTKGPSQLGS